MHHSLRTRVITNVGLVT